MSEACGQFIKDRLDASLAYDARIRREASPGFGFIYMAQCEGFVKIGVTQSDTPDARIASFQVGNPFPVKMLRFWRTDNAWEAEGMLHLMFAQFLVRGEWFKLPTEILEMMLRMSDTDLAELPVKMS